MPPTSGSLPDTAKALAAIQAAAHELADDAADLIREVAPVSSTPDPNREGGRLKASIKGYDQPTAEGAVMGATTDVPYDNPDWGVRKGTGPHDIYPVHGTALRWYIAGGGVAFARHVSHPGTHPNDYPKIAEPRILTMAHEHLAVRIREGLTGS